MAHHEQANEKKSPAQQADEVTGRIKQRQQTDRNMADTDTARGSEAETRGSSGRRG